jgi:alpha-tubulin suppressor-like RCC1 family protein
MNGPYFVHQATAQFRRVPKALKLRRDARGPRRYASNKTSGSSTYAPKRSWYPIPVASVAGAILLAAYSMRELHAEVSPTPVEVTIEKSKKRKNATKEETRDLISSQHVQVKKSWENPGVYGWGSNTGRVAAPDSDESVIKTPRRISYFDDVLLRDLKLDRKFGAAITEDGDLLQWGKGYSEEEFMPTKTLRGKDLVSLCLSRDRIIALSSSGKVYSIPVSKADQDSGPKPSEDSWFPFWKGRSLISYRTLQPANLGWKEKVSKLDGGLEHVLLLTNSGRVFSAASGTEDFPSRGQLGIPGLTWLTRPEGPYDMCHEITTLRGFDISQIAAGDYHSLALDKDGRVFAFGDNSSGQLGFDYNSEAPFVDAPSLLPTQRLYSRTNQQPKVTSIAAGGANSFFMLDATRIAGPGENLSSARGLGKVTADTWSCGNGLVGTLGNGKWTHAQGTPVKIPSLSGLFEYDEKAHRVIPIRLAHISVGSTHASAVMDNVTYLGATDKSSENDTNWGADIVWWGGNEFFQLGTGKRNNVSAPLYIQPLDTFAEKAAGRKEEHRFHITPKHRVTFKGRKVNMEQRVECGRNVTAVYSAGI